MDTDKIKIAIIDNDISVAESYRDSLSFKAHGIEVVLIFQTPEKFKSYCEENDMDVDILLIDMEFEKPKDGLQVLDYLNTKSQGKEYKPIILSGQAYSRDLIDECKKLGAKAYVEKKTPMKEIVEILKQVNKGFEKFPQLPKIDMEHKRLCDVYNNLTPKEKEVFIQYVTSKDKSEIEQKLGLQARTLDKHLTAIRQEFKVQIDTHLVAIAIELEIPEVLAQLKIKRIQ